MTRGRFAGMGFAAALLLAKVPAFAGPVSSSLNIISSNTIGRGTLGTVTLTQNGAGEVDVAVTLAPNTDFVDTGVSQTHNAFVFNRKCPEIGGIRGDTPPGRPAVIQAFQL